VSYGKTVSFCGIACSLGAMCILIETGETSSSDTLDDSVRLTNRSRNWNINRDINFDQNFYQVEMIEIVAHLPFVLQEIGFVPGSLGFLLEIGFVPGTLGAVLSMRVALALQELHLFK
jgi:hypothetical protein